MSKVKKMKLQPLNEGECDIKEMFINEDGKILRVIPKVYNKEYKGLNLYQETCEIGKNPIFLHAFAIYGLMLPCVVTEAIDWVNEDYSNFEEILFYPATTTEDYMEEICYKDMAITLNKNDFYPLYQKYNNILGIEEYILDEDFNQISYPVRLYDWKGIVKSRFTITTLMRQQLREWRKVLPKAYFILEYRKRFSDI